MTPITALIIPITILLIAAILYQRYTRERKHSEAARKAALELGFQLVKEVEPDLINRIFQFHQKSKGQILRVRNVFERAQGDCTLYLFDLLDYRGDIVNHLADGAIAVESHLLHLPRLSIYPKMGDLGHVSGWADVLLEKLALDRRNQIVLGINPYFEKNYILTGENEQEVREFFSNNSLSDFSEQKFWQIEAGGDLFTVASLESKRNIGIKSQADPRNRIQEALGLFDLFKSSEPLQ